MSSPRAAGTQCAHVKLSYLHLYMCAVGKCDVGRNSTLGIVKPHLVTDGAAGLALDCVQVSDLVRLNFESNFVRSGL